MADTAAGPNDGDDASRHLEVETKLDVDADFRLPDLTDADAVRAAGIARAGAPERIELAAVYFDTAGCDLLRSRVTLRRRSGGGDAGWHLKLPAGAGARTEVRFPLSAGDGERVPDALASLVLGLARGRPVLPVARLATSRTARDLLRGDGTAVIEVVDDAVTAIRLPSGGGGGDGGASEPLHWRELEVEVLGGDAMQLAAVVATLIAAGARPAAHGSKLARAWGMTDPPTVGGGGVRATAAEVVISALARYRQQLLEADVGMREPEPDAEALHDARAAARRIRSVLTVYAPLFLPGRTGQLIKALRALGVAIGATRDLDVVADRILSGLGDDEPIAAHLRVDLAERRRRNLDELQHYLRGAEYVDTLRDLDHLVDEPPWTALAARPARPAREVLGPLLAAAWMRLQARADAALAAPDRHDLAHDARKAAKTVRYAAETAEPALGRVAADLAAFAERIQDVLGHHQDAVTTLAVLSARPTDGSSVALPADVAATLRPAQSADVDRTFREFAALWSRRP